MAKESQVKSRRKLLNPVFHLQTKKEDDSVLTRGLIKIVRKSGQLNLSGRSLAHVPESMFKMYEITEDDKVNYEFSKQKTDDEDVWWSFKPLCYLDLSSNVLQELPSQLGMFEDLSVLNLQDNNFTSLPPEIGKLIKLTKLNLSHNKINNLPDEFFKLTELQSLSLSHNQLETISKALGDLVMLQQLDLSNNCLVKLPPGIGFLVRLTEINLSNNKLTKLPPDIVNLRGLLKFDVTQNDLKSLPKMGELRKLQFLYAQHNDIEELPDFEGCESLQQIYFGNNFIKEIPTAFCENMVHLKILELRDNTIPSIPDEIAMLQKLIRLDMTNNDLTDLPKTLALLPQLQNIQLEGNMLRKIKADVIRNGTVAVLRYLRQQLDSDDLEKAAVVPKGGNTLIPVNQFPDKYTMGNTQTLNLTMKKLTKIPDKVFDDAAFGQVGIVNLCKNKFTEVPSGLAKIGKNLGEINLSHNQITKIPEFFGDFKRLGYLDLSINLLSDLPDSMGDLEYLRELALSYNQFEQLPKCIYEMKGLEILYANDNKITEIFIDGLKKLKRLSVLDFTNNNITHVPFELGTLTQIRGLELKGNCFRSPRHQILEKGTDAVLVFLRSRIERSNKRDD